LAGTNLYCLVTGTAWLPITVQLACPKTGKEICQTHYNTG